MRDNRYRRRVARHCAACQVSRPEKSGPDPCLGWLPGVRFACCGHGSRPRAYVVLHGGVNPPTVLRGDPALDKMRELGGDPPIPTKECLTSIEEDWPRDQ